MDKHTKNKNAIKLLDIMGIGGVTRKVAAESLGMSSNAMRNLVAAMISSEIIKEYTGKSGLPGRSAKILIPCTLPVFAIVHILYDSIVTHFFGYNLKLCGTDTVDIDDHLFIDDVFVSYFRKLSARRSCVRGICLVSDGVPNDGRFRDSAVPGLSGIDFKAFAKESLPDAVLLLENRYTSAVKDTSGINAIFSDEYGFPRIYILNEGKLINGRNSVLPYGFYHHKSERDFSNKLKYSNDNNEYVRTVAEIFCDIINLIHPMRLYFKSGRYTHVEPLITKVFECLSLDYSIPVEVIPEIIPEGEKFDLTLPSLCRLVRDKYVESVNFCRSDK